MKQVNVFGSESKKLQISKLLFFDVKGVEMIALGLRSGVGILKNAIQGSILSDKEETRIIPKNFEEYSKKITKKQQNSMTEEGKSQRSMISD